jgi:hypothetical protein
MGGRGGCESITGFFFPAGNLGPYTKEKQLTTGEECPAMGTIWVLESENEGGVVTFFVGGGGFDPTWFLCDLEGGVGGVVGSEWLVALIRGVCTAGLFKDTCGVAVYEDFGPFNIGPCWDVIIEGCVVGFKEGCLG